MRLEIVIPDSTLPDLKAQLATLAEQLSAKPELVTRINLEDDDEATVQAMFTPERLAHIDAAIAEVKDGTFYTEAQVEEHFARKKASWQRPSN